MGLSSDWFNGRKVKLNLGAWEHLFTDIVLSVDMGGNKEVTGAVGVFQVCTFIVSIDLHKCPVHGDLTVFAGLLSLEELNLGDSNCAGNLASLATCVELKRLNLRWTKSFGDIKALISLPALERLDLTGVVKIKGSIEVLGFIESLEEIRLQQTSVEGDVWCFETLSSLTTVDVSRTALEGSIQVFENAPGLTHLSCVDTAIDVDSLGSLKKVLKNCDIKVSN